MQVEHVERRPHLLATQLSRRMVFGLAAGLVACLTHGTNAAGQTPRPLLRDPFAAGKAGDLGTDQTVCLSTVPNHPDGTSGLQTAITTAQPGETLRLCPGTWSIARRVVISKALSIEGAGAGATRLDGHGQSALLAVSPAASVMLTHLTLTRGGGFFSGGAITTSGELTLRHCALIDNSGFRAGAIFRKAGSITVEACDLQGNRAALRGGVLTHSDQRSLDVRRTV